MAEYDWFPDQVRDDTMCEFLTWKRVFPCIVDIKIYTEFTFISVFNVTTSQRHIQHKALKATALRVTLWLVTLSQSSLVTIVNVEENVMSPFKSLITSDMRRDVTL